MHKIVVGQININSVGNKLDLFMTAVAENIEILLITETKIFPQTNSILMAITYPTDMTVTPTVVAF